MSKRLSILISLMSIVLLAKGQQIETFPQDKTLTETRVLYQQGNYAAALATLDRYLSHNQAAAREASLAEAYYYKAMSEARLGRGDADEILKSYIEQYPETADRSRVWLGLGAFALSKSDYERATYYLSEVAPEGLSRDERAECQVRFAYAMLKKSLKQGKSLTPNEAATIRRFLAESANSKGQWYEPANLYLAQLDFIEGKNLQDIEPTLSRLKSKEMQDEAASLRAQITYVNGNHEEAANEIERLFRRKPSYTERPELLRTLGLSYYEIDDYVNAIANLGIYRNMGPAEANDPEAALALGIALFQQGAYEKATIPLLIPTTSQDDDLAALAGLYLGQAELKLGRTEEAIMALDAAAGRKDAPDAIREVAMYNLAVAMHKSGSSGFGQSVAVAETFFATFPQSSKREAVGRILSESYYLSKDYTASLESIGRVKNPTKEIIAAKQYVLVRQASVSQDASRHTEAEGYLTSAIALGAISNSYNEALLARANIRYESNRYKEAAYDAQAFLRTKQLGDANTASAHYLLGYSLFNQKRYGEAYQVFADYVGATNATQAQIFDARIRMADCLYAQRQFGQAIPMYQSVADRSPEAAPTALYRLAEIYNLQGNYQKQIQTIDRLLQISPDNAYAAELLYERGRASILQGEPIASSLASLNKVVQGYSTTRWARLASLEIAMLHSRSGQTDDAIRAYKSVISTYPGSEEARSAFSDLKALYLATDNVEAYTSYANSLGGRYVTDENETARLLFLQAETRFFNAAPTAAQSLRDYINKHPNSPDTARAKYYLAQLEEKGQNSDEAIRLYQEAADASPAETSAPALYRLGLMQEANKDYAAAYASYQQAAKLSDDAADRTDYNVAAIRTAYLSKHYKEAIMIASTDEAAAALPASQLYIARSEEETGNNSEAAVIYNKIRKDLDTEVGAEAWFRLADMRFRQGKNEEARALCVEMAKESTPQLYWLARVFVVLSDTYAKEGNKAKAKQYLESVKRNYKGQENDIQEMINSRLAKLN